MLHYIWDPIGVQERQKHETSTTRIYTGAFGRLRDGAGAKEIADYLVEIEITRMGMTSNGARATYAAEVLVDWRGCLSEGLPSKVLQLTRPRMRG